MAIAGAEAPHRISPTDVAQFVRLEQCERYLKLRLRERVEGSGFLSDYGVVPQSIPPLLTRSGATFEQQVEARIGEGFRAINLRPDEEGSTGAPDHNQTVVEAVTDLAPGEAVVFFQPQLVVPIGEWQLRGVADVIRCERRDDGSLAVLVADIKS